MSGLVPQPFDRLLARALRDLEAGRGVFGLPRRSFWAPREGLDLSVTLPSGRRAANPLGPAAGPHTQLAPNIVAAWLAGARVIELKTVQALDRLEIPRPCIDAPGPAWNVEWSQELRLEDSARQYAVAWYLVHVLGARGAGGAAAGTVFDASAGYDLAGLRSAGVARFLDTLRDAGAELAALRDALPAGLRAAADVDVPACIADTVTVSTFHGCPPDEVERMVEHLFARHALHVVVKLNPTLLGFETVEGLLRGTLGWSDVEPDPAAFASDLGWEDALAMLDRLHGAAARHGLTLGVKFTNTLVVRNTRGRLAGDVAYLSGPPLHVLATRLADRFARATGGRFPVSFSAGLCAENFADAVACGFAPTTTCTDLLLPTGYRRLVRYLKSLEADMARLGASDLDAYALARCREGGGRATAVPAEAARSNLERYAAGVADEPRYHGPAPSPPGPRRPLAAVDCDACNNCVLVCPNLAFVAVDLPAGSRVAPEATWRDGEPWLSAGDVVTTAERQYVLLADACNECGHCDTHCPQEGGPFRVKPRLAGGP